MKTKKSLNPQIVAPVERTTATSRNAASQGVDAAVLFYGIPFLDDGE